MDQHFRAFSFVDRITAMTPKNIAGAYAIPERISAFPASLVAEAVGQLAAWSAMASTNFQRRPVAGLAAKIELLDSVRPGQLLELSADLQSVDDEAIAYGGVAHAQGKPIIRLHDCVGHMVLVTDFDDPQALRDRFSLLCGPGADAGGFPGTPLLTLEPQNGETAGPTGQQLRAAFRVPSSAPFFADHFPRRAVFPGSLLMHMNLELAAALACQIPTPTPNALWRLASVSDVKLRTFIEPGEQLECESRLSERSDHHAIVAVETR